MIAGIAALIFVPLLAVASVHLLWAFGSTWPVQDRKTLAQTVVGSPNVERMPSRLLTALIAIAIFTAGIWALSMADPARHPLLTAGGFVLTAVFLGRGLIGYTSWWRQLTPEEPFATFDKKVYSPLCLGIGAGFAFLTVWRLLL